ncbi:conserved short-chain dehydrogenase [Patulibacter medicamentivorans]|uniref:Conserved short-chain dehydrogenase n=1 Tax=Patulibacter medicamentivorans TaxID=1097667 RepID=H0E2T9_9ACTN|nr:SDR family NAD(P)-dependent oxidoreductase [Patulibacter medicamentivorans]EHN12017.1 conserved short-chain dehydrogenase [Patulibacter medicamentivorans]
MQLAGRTVLITGATGGLGHAIARALAREGATLVLTGRRAEVLQPLADELGAVAVSADLSSREDVERLAADHGEVDVVVHNAALPGSGPLDDYALEDADRVLEVNLRAPIALTRLLLPAMKRRGSGHHVYVSSMSAKVPTADASLYAGTKLGLRGFAQALRPELKPAGIGVSVVFPGFIRDAGMFADTKVELPRGVGTNTPEDVATAVVRAIVRNKGEVDVAPVGVRASGLLNALFPGLPGRLSGKLGGERVGTEMAQAQRVKR